MHASGDMDKDVLIHLERIESIITALDPLPWLTDGETERIRADLLSFDSCYWPFLRLLTPPLYLELTGLLEGGAAARWGQSRPEIAVVMPVYNARRKLLEAALSSLRQQVGVAITCLISIDGRGEDRELVEEVLDDLNAREPQPGWTILVLPSVRNLGVGRCRNQALRQIRSPYFTCLDADDIFHPLRCLHALLLLEQLGVERLNTGWSRVSLNQRKLILINGVLSSHGHNSFVAHTRILERYGYLADLRVNEDTEYQQRLQYFGAPMQTTSVVGHFLNSEVTPGYQSLSTPLRLETQVIDDHPYLCGTVIAAADDERRRIEQQHQQLYGKLISEALLAAFPGE